MDLEKNELIDLINEEVTLKASFEPTKLFKCFSKCLVKTILDIYNKFKDLDNFDLHNSIILGTNMFHNVFWILMLYSNNIKLTIFLSERSVLLFTEFILMSREAHIDKELYFKPTIIDAITFSYKKTIGPINISSIKNHNAQRINTLKESTKILSIILQEYSKILFFS